MDGRVPSETREPASHVPSQRLLENRSSTRPTAVRGGARLGNIRPTYIKRVAIELVKRFPSEFTEDYQHNKRKVQELTDVRSPGMRNKIAGYLTRYRQVLLQAK